MTELVATVREKNGADCPIVLLYGVMNTNHAASYLKLLNLLGGKANRIYVKTVIRGSDGAKNGHPTRENYRVNAGLLADYVKDIL